MNEVLTVKELIGPAFLAGVLTFLAPCTLPLVPAYIAFISGSSLDEIVKRGKNIKEKVDILLNSISYIAGFSFVFILFGILGGFIAREISSFRIWLTRIGGLIIIIFGLYMLRLISIPLLNKEWHPKLPAFFRVGNPVSSFVFGISFAMGWTPCVGPVLASIFLLTSASSTVAEGGFLLLVFSLGLAVPFLLTALSVEKSLKYIKRYSGYLWIFSVFGGVLLILVGFLILTNRFSLLLSWGYKIFGFLGYERIVNYL